VERQIRTITKQTDKQGFRLSEKEMRDVLGAVLVAVELWGDEIYAKHKAMKEAKGVKNGSN
jgi:hypothetical protein